jgi:hypothetical protein
MTRSATAHANNLSSVQVEAPPPRIRAILVDRHVFSQPRMRSSILLSALIPLLSGCATTQSPPHPSFQVIAFFTGKEDDAHISFVHEAVRWFPAMGSKYHFAFDTTSDWHNLNASFLARYQVVVFLDTRPDDPAARAAFETYMKHGGAWMGFHFAAFALTPSAYPADWPWYHDTFLGSGQYVSNSWRPTSAVLRVEDRAHPVTAHLPPTFISAPNEWYRWQYDLRRNPDIDILAAIDSSSFPLGTGPKQSEIWHDGYYPVVWSNRRYRMLYLNMGHNDIDYEHRLGPTNATLSHTFDNAVEDRLILDGLFWLAGKPAP